MYYTVPIANLQVYSAMGYPIFPCHSSGTKAKAPLTPNGFKDATHDMAQIEVWHRQYPSCAWGVLTTSERGVLDIDPRHGGDKHLEELVAKYGALPLTPKALTGGGGEHFYMSFPPGTKSRKIAEGIDLKAEGGYVIIPPSKIDIPEHQGRSYRWGVCPWETPLAVAPAWLQSLKPQANKPEADNPWIVQESEPYDLLTHPGADKDRHATLWKLVGIHLSRDDSEASIYAMAEAWAKRCNRPLLDWREQTEGIIRKEARKKNEKEELNPSLPAQDKPRETFPLPIDPPVSSLSLHADAYYGLFGEMLLAVEPETEASQPAVLLAWLTYFGCIVGRGAWAVAGARLHYPTLYVGNVCESGQGKGEAPPLALWTYKQVEPAWAAHCICYGVGSGEGLIERVADAVLEADETGVMKIVQFGSTDKRCLLRLSELSRCFKAGRRENATLSEVVREGWDGEPIHIPNRKGNALSASAYSISLHGDIQPALLNKLLANGTEGFDGFANRFLWALTGSERDLPEGGNPRVLEPFLPRLAEALDFGKTAGLMERDAEAKALWAEVYGDLKRSGQTVPHTDRGRGYVLRLSEIYALADKTATMSAPHLKAALAVWAYCRESARRLFTVKGQAPEPLSVTLLASIRNAPGISRSGLREVAGHKVSAEVIESALADLEAKGLAHCDKVQGEGAGRSAECWYPGGREGANSPSPEVELNPSLPKHESGQGEKARVSIEEIAVNPEALTDEAFFAKLRAVDGLPQTDEDEALWEEVRAEVKAEAKARAAKQGEYR